MFIAAAADEPGESGIRMQQSSLLFCNRGVPGSLHLSGALLTCNCLPAGFGQRPVRLLRTRLD